jgi:type II secretory ATPase GspE/PulE/Tfp pilus assembly ATPase PilB-like protein
MVTGTVTSLRGGRLGQAAQGELRWAGREGRSLPEDLLMLSDRTGPHNVTIGLIDGATKIGRIPRFSPLDPDLMLEVSGSGGRTLRLALAAERIAFVGFHRHGGGAEPAEPAEPALTRRVHLGSGKSFAVTMSAEAPRSRLGFYARLVDPTSSFEEIFFYAHAQSRVEEVDLLGQMLVDDGHLTRADLERGLTEQVVRRNVPIGQILLEQQKIEPASLEEVIALQVLRRKRLGEILIEEGLARTVDIERALAEQKRRAGKRLGDILVELNMVTENALARTLAKKFQLPFIDLDECAINPEAAQEVSAELLQTYCVLPLDIDAHLLTVAISDPLATDVRDKLRFTARRRIQEVVATPSQLREYVDRLLDAQAKSGAATTVDKILDDLGMEEQSGEDGQGPAAPAEAEDSAVIKLVNQIITDACQAGASDIHIEPNGRERSAVIRFRVDGECVAYRDIPPAFRRALVARLKVMARLDISERRKPQDGKIRVNFGTKHVELRVAVLPSVGGEEDVVLRILADSKPRPLDRMGMSLRNLSALRALIARPYGLVLCVGPTGSGKTTTLHSVLGALNTIDMKIWTAEDPVEITQAGLRQIQMNPKIGLTFASTMRAFLRADPDVIMVGEMRDEETASIAVEASLTGHLVLSTLHTNSAPETVTRLLDMGLDPFTFGDALLGVLAQRLARTLCKGCRVQYEGTRAEWDELTRYYDEGRLEARLGGPFGPAFKLWRAPGCEACRGAGYRGRLALHELLVSDDAIRELIGRKAPIAEIRRAAVAGGMSTLVEDGIEKALAGEVDLRQVFAVASR